MNSIYKIADLNVAITSVFDEVHDMLSSYRVEHATPDLSVCTDENDIRKESEYSDLERSFEGLPEYTFADSYLETLAIYRKLCSELPSFRVLLMHGSVIAVNGEAYLFTAASGTGKSTHVRLWRELFKEQAVMINDDKPLVRLSENDVPIVYGTPWDGKHHLSTNTSAKLKAICILERGEVNEIEPITLEEAYPMLLQQTFRPQAPERLMEVMQLLGSVGSHTKLFRLRCNMNPDAAKVAYEGMQ